MKTAALLYLGLFSIDGLFSSLNMAEDGVSKSTLSMIRAARFCIFDTLSMFVLCHSPNDHDK